MNMLIIVSAIIVFISCCSPDPLTRYFDNVTNELPQEAQEPTRFVDEIQLKFTVTPKNVDAKIGHSLTLECGANGIPQPKIHWLKNGQRIHQAANEDDDNDFEKILNMGMLTIQNSITLSKLKVDCVTLTTSGEYQCVADNGYKKIVSTPATVLAIGSEGSLARCRSVKRDVLPGHSPQIYMWTDAHFQLEGAIVQLFCRAKGSPEPVIYWMDNEDNVLTDSKKYAVLRNGDLLIKQSDWKMMGLFKCVASNDNGKDIVQTFLYPTAPEPAESIES